MSNTSESRPKGLTGLKVPEDAPWGLSPSDFAFLWDDCPRCFYMKVARKHLDPPRPSQRLRPDRPGHEGVLSGRTG